MQLSAFTNKTSINHFHNFFTSYFSYATSQQISLAEKWGFCHGTKIRDKIVIVRIINHQKVQCHQKGSPQPKLTRFFLIDLVTENFRNILVIIATWDPLLILTDVVINSVIKFTTVFRVITVAIFFHGQWQACLSIYYGSHFRDITMTISFPRR